MEWSIDICSVAKVVGAREGRGAVDDGRGALSSCWQEASSTIRHPFAAKRENAASTSSRCIPHSGYWLSRRRDAVVVASL